MRKKIILINALSTFFSLIILLITSSLIIYSRNLDDYKISAKNYLSLTCSIFNGSNIQETNDALKETKSDIRLTIIDLNGNVVFDSGNTEIDENHLNRPEIQELNVVYRRYSSTENKDMLYVADIDDGYYVRVSLDMGDVNKIFYFFLIFGIAILIFIEALVVSLSFYFTKKGLTPINKNLAKLGHLVKKDVNSYEFSIDTLPAIIDEISTLIDEQMTRIQHQKNDMVSVLNIINQGVIALDAEGNVFFVNESAKKDLGIENSFENDNYIYLIRNVELQKSIENSLSSKSSQILNVEINDKIFSVFIISIDQEWLRGGLILSLEDITKYENLKKIKKDFFDNASHELKSPITSVIGYSQLISHGMVDDKNEIVEYSRKIYNEALRMNSIIYDMLNISELEQGYVLNKQDVSFNKVILDNLDALEAQINKKNIKVELNIKEISIISDYRLVDELVRNLIDNAIKYNKESGKIIITLDENSFSVKDTGIGIKRSDQSRIFERFYMVNKARSKESGGTGLGLSIVKHIIEILNYRIEVKSKINLGSEFIVYFH